MIVSIFDADRGTSVHGIDLAHLEPGGGVAKPRPPKTLEQGAAIYYGIFVTGLLDAVNLAGVSTRVTTDDQGRRYLGPYIFVPAGRFEQIGFGKGGPNGGRAVTARPAALRKIKALEKQRGQ